MNKFGFSQFYKMHILHYFALLCIILHFLHLTVSEPISIVAFPKKCWPISLKKLKNNNC